MNPQLSPCAFAVLSACLVALVLSPSAHAANAAWNGTTDTLWSTATNWSGSSIPGVGNTATFNNAGNAKTTIDVGTISLSQISFNLAAAAAYTLGATPGTGTITFADGTTTAVTMASTVTNNEIINANLTLGTAVASTTTFQNNGSAALLTLGGNITGGTGGTAAAKTVNFTGSASANSGNITVGGIISDGGASSVALTKVGGGTLTLTGVNTYTGSTTVSPALSATGTMNVNGASGSLANTSSVTVNGFGQFNLGDATNGLANRINTNASLTLGSNLGYGYFTVYRGSATANSQSFTSLNVGAAGSGKIDVVGATGGVPTLTFSGATPYVRGSGGMVNMNTTNMPVSFTTAPSGAGNVANGILLGAVMNNNSFILAQSGAATATTYVNDTWASGTYTTVTLASNTAYDNVTTDALRFNAASKTVNLTGTNTIQSGGIIVGSAASGASTISGGTIQTGVAGGDLWVHMYTGTTPLTIDSAIGDNGGSGLTVGTSGGGAPILTLTGNNSYAGATTVTGGATLNIQNSNALGTTAAGTTVITGAGLQLQGDINVGAEDLTLNGSGPGNLGALRNISGNNTWGGNITTGGGRITVDAGSLTINGNYSGTNVGPTLTTTLGNLTVNGVMSFGTGGFLKNSAGALVLNNAANSFSGNVNINHGSVVVGATGALGTSTVNLGYSATTATDVPALLISGAYTVNRTITVGSQTNATAYNAILGGSNTSGTSTYNGSITLSTTATAYTFTLQAATGGTVEFKTGTWTNAGNKAITVGSAGNDGTVLISNALAGTGAVSVNAGTLLSANSAALNATSAVNVNNAGSTLAVKYGGGSDYNEAQVNTLLAKANFNATTTAFAFDTTNGNGTYSTAFTKAAGLTKLGTNTLTLTAANTYTGGTTVTAGTLLVDVGASIGNGAVAVNGGQFTVNGDVGNGGVTVASGAFLGGSGTIGGTTIVNGNINPGNSPGTLSFTAALSLNGTATMQITGVSPGVYDILNGNGSNTLTLGGTLALDNTGYTATLGDSIQIFKNWQTIGGSFSSITGTGLNDGLSWSTTNLGSTGFITVVPEPTTWALLAFSLTTVMVLRRRRNS